MSKADENNKRTVDAIKAIIGDQDIDTEQASILVTLEGVVAGTLLAVTHFDHRTSAILMNEALVEGVERRLAYAKSKGIVR